MKITSAFLVVSLLPLACIAAEPTYVTAAPAGSKCATYDISDIIKSIDLNGDGKLSKEEWTKVNAPPSSYQIIEKDKKGYITPAEFIATAPPPPATIDTNQDCKITLIEMQAMEKNPPAGGPLPTSPPASGGTKP